MLGYFPYGECLSRRTGTKRKQNKDEREKGRRATKGKEAKKKGREYQKGEENERIKMNE